MRAERLPAGHQRNAWIYRLRSQMATGVLSGPARRRRAVMAAAALTVGLGLVWLGVPATFGLARDTSGMWEFIHNEAEHRLQPLTIAPQAPGVVARPVAVRSAAVRPRARGSVREASAAPVPAPGHRAVCVRLCDGFFFPVGDVKKEGDLAGQEAICQGICPGAPTHVYLLAPGADSIESASRDGHPYSALPVAFRNTRTADSTCTCKAASDGTRLSSLLHDITLRRGDAVATHDSLRVFKGSSHWPYRSSDFLSLAQAKGFEAGTVALSAIERALRAPQMLRSFAAAKLPVTTVPKPKALVETAMSPQGNPVRVIGAE